MRATTHVRENVRDLAERTMVTAMTVNPLAAMDRSQLLSALARVGTRAVMRPEPLLRRTAGLAQEIGSIAVGTSPRAPNVADRRFADSTFHESAVYRRLMQTYLAWREAL